MKLLISIPWRKELFVFSLCFLAFSLVSHCQPPVSSSIYIDTVSTIDSTADTTTTSLLDVDNINKFQLASPVNTLDLSDLSPRQKMRLVRQLQRLSAKNQRFYMRVITRTIRTKEKYSYKETINLAKINARIVHDSLKYYNNLRDVELDAQVREHRITARFETKQKRIESHVSAMVAWLSFSVLINVLLMYLYLRKILA